MRFDGLGCNYHLFCPAVIAVYLFRLAAQKSRPKDSVMSV